MIPDVVLNQILDRVDIVEIIGSRIPVKNAGRNFKGCCPFHQEFLYSSFFNEANGSAIKKAHFSLKKLIKRVFNGSFGPLAFGAACGLFKVEFC